MKSTVQLELCSSNYVTYYGWHVKGGAHSNHYRMQECTSSRPLPTTHHKPLTANDIHTYCISIRLHANAWAGSEYTYARIARTYIIHEAGRPLGYDYIRTA